MKMSYVRLVVGIALLSLVALASCELFGSEEGVTRDERRDAFVAQIKAGSFDRLNGNMHPSVRVSTMNAASYWEDKLDAAGAGWELTVLSTNEVKIDSSPDGSAEGTLTFSYGESNDDYFFLEINHSTLGKIAPPE